MIVLGIVALPINATALVVGEKKIEFAPFLFQGNLTPDSYNSFSIHDPQDSDDYFYIDDFWENTVYKGYYDGTYQASDDSKSYDALIESFKPACHISSNSSIITKTCKINGENVETDVTPEGVSFFGNLEEYEFLGKSYHYMFAVKNGQIFGLIDNEGNIIVPFGDHKIGGVSENNYYLLELINPDLDYDNGNVTETIHSMDGEVVYTFNNANIAEMLDVEPDSIPVEKEYLGEFNDVFYFAISVTQEDGSSNNYLFGTDNTLFLLGEAGSRLYYAELMVENGKALIAAYGNTTSVYNVDGDLLLGDVDDVIQANDSATFLRNIKADYNLLFVEKDGKTDIYDYDFNKLYTINAEDVELVAYPKNIGNLAAGNYIFEYEVEYNPHRVLMTITDFDHLEVDGKLVDGDDNPMKSTKIELHSEVKTIVTDNLGQFNFTDVLEGNHTLSVIDKNGNVIKSINVSFVPGASTSVANNVVTYKNTIKELSIKVKLNGDDLSIVSVTEGLTNVAEVVDAGKTPEPVEKEEISVPDIVPEVIPENPETGDNILLSICFLIMSVTGVYISIKQKRNA